MYGYLLLLAVVAATGLQGWRTLFNNFAVDEIGLNGFQVGAIQSVREIPGFLALLVIFLLIFIREHRLAALSIVVMGAGVVLTGLMPSFMGLLLTTLIMSLGFHYFETVNQSLTLQYFTKTASPHVFARIRSLSAATNIGVGVVIYLLAQLLSFRDEYLIIGGFVVLCGVLAFFGTLRIARYLSNTRK